MSFSLYKARWILPVQGEPVEDAAVLVKDGTIVAAGRAKDVGLLAPKEANTVDYQDSILIPGLVNVHCHLELSWLEGLIPPGLGFSGWLRRLMSLIHAPDSSHDFHNIGGPSPRVIGAGTVLVGDVGNSPRHLEFIRDLEGSGCHVHFFWERLHPFSSELVLETLPEALIPLVSSWSYSPHSVYTCSAQAISSIKRACRLLARPMTIHCCESEEEIEFVQDKRGEIANILKERGRDIDGFFTPSPSPILLLDRLGVLDSQTICVHCVHVDERDVQLVKDRGAWFCLCPRSNLYITNQLPPFDLITSKNYKNICIGTDSLASNWDLSIFSEMKVFYQKCTDISPEQVLEFATLSGARALGMDRFIGAITPGRMASMCVVRTQARSRPEAYEIVCSGPEEGRVEQVVPTS